MSTLLPGVVNDIHPSARNNWFIEGAKWFDVDQMAVGKALKDTYKNYKNYTHKAKQQGNYCKKNFTFDKMKELLGVILDENVKEAPQQVQLKLPKLKKVGEDSNLPKLKLPKLKKLDV